MVRWAPRRAVDRTGQADTPASGGQADTPAGGRQADTPAGGGQADTPVGAMVLMDIRAYTIGEGGYKGSPDERQGRCISSTYRIVPALPAQRTAIYTRY